MHDPLVVAHKVVLPIPVRRWRYLGEKRSCFLRRRRRTNEENLGEPVYPWWRPAGYETRLFSYEIGLYRLATVWHREPRSADSGDVCPHHKRVGDEYVPARAWRWHVHHWRIQVHPYQALRRWLFDRCATCHRPFRDGHSPVTFHSALAAENERLKAKLRERDREARKDERAASIEARWMDRNDSDGAPHGSY